MKRCGISLERLGDYYEGRADEATATQIRTHLDSGCAHCREGLAWLQETANTLLEVQQVQVPQHMLNRASALFRERYLAPVRPSLLARLVFDSRLNLAFAGAREEASQTRQLRYTTETHEIELWEEKAREGGWYLMGQVLPREGGAAMTPQAATLTPSEGPPLSATQARIGEATEFHFPEVPAGVYQLALLLNEVELQVPDVTVGL